MRSMAKGRLTRDAYGELVQEGDLKFAMDIVASVKGNPILLARAVADLKKRVALLESRMEEMEMQNRLLVSALKGERPEGIQRFIFEDDVDDMRGMRRGGGGVLHRGLRPVRADAQDVQAVQGVPDSGGPCSRENHRGEEIEMITKGMMSSLTDQWATPWYFFDALDREFHFTLDVCAGEYNHKVDRYFDESADGLAQDWTKDVCWMNPPYGRVIEKWMAKAAETGRNGGIVVCLVPARTDTAWWRKYAMQASEIRFVSGRIKFGDSGQGAPFPSAVVIFGTPTTPRMVQWEVKEGKE